MLFKMQINNSLVKFKPKLNISFPSGVMSDLKITSSLEKRLLVDFRSLKVYLVSFSE